MSTNATAATKPRSKRRTVSRVLAASAVTLGLAAAGGYLYLDNTSDAQRLGTTSCAAVKPSGAAASQQSLREICATLDELTGAWARADAVAYGAVFTEDATYTSYIGTHYEGRADIAEGHRAGFASFLEGTKLADSYLNVRFYGPDTAVVTSRGDTYKGERKKQADLSKVQTYTVVKQDGRWLIAAFQNTKRQNVMEKFSFLWAPDTTPAAER
ncbi:SgcJ/EcaC family oxidoreductase [Nocardia sp. NPDC052566]|uniref:SgcJ/EcaC family oxidoreductase n=1 Tax=Nocardia sp. NPDC052566 TaxID=3364330 RepID=UPI0037C6B986